jgi:hypothetical protein
MLCVLLVAAAPRVGHAQAVDPAFARRFGELALACVHQEYPNQIAHVLHADEDARPPRELTPAFYGCYDWHSSVHGHWLLARLVRRAPGSELAGGARAALHRSLTPENVAGEVSYLEGPGRAHFERPYGLAWLLQLAAELREWDDPQAQRWSRTLQPLETAVIARLADWMPKLTSPIRSGEHSQTAFAFGLIHDYATTIRDSVLLRLVDERVRTLYIPDRDCPLGYEPSGQDFLSPCLAEADLVRRVLPRPEFARWLTEFLSGLPIEDDGGAWLPVAIVIDREDPKLAHLDGLNLSRAWMLEGIASGLPDDDLRLPALLAAARAHRDAGLVAVTGEHYVGGHWLGSFAMYLVTGRGHGDAPNAALDRGR